MAKPLSSDICYQPHKNKISIILYLLSFYFINFYSVFLGRGKIYNIQWIVPLKSFGGYRDISKRWTWQKCQRSVTYTKSVSIWWKPHTAGDIFPIDVGVPAINKDLNLEVTGSWTSDLKHVEGQNYRSYIIRHKSQLYMSCFKIRSFQGSCTLTTTTLSSMIEQLNTTRQPKSLVTSPEGVHIYFFLIGLLTLIYYQQGKIVEVFANISVYLGYSVICLYPEYCFV